jgi:gliding motility-associated protein GldM
MAGAKETPRQKMVGLMYLVLMALLALNVTKAVLDAFVAIEDNIQKSCTKQLDRGDSYIADLKSELSDLSNPLKTQKVNYFLNIAKKIDVETAKRIKEIDEIKLAILEKSGEKIDQVKENDPESIIWKNYDTKSPLQPTRLNLMAIQAKDQYDIPMHEIIGDELTVITGSGKDLWKHYNEFRNNICHLVGTYEIGEKKYSFNPTNINKFKDNNELNLLVERLIAKNTINTNEDKEVLKQLYTELTKNERYNTEEEKNIHWIGKTFDHSPLVAAIASLTSMQQEILTARATALAHIKGKVTVGDYSFNKVTALAYGPASVNQGDNIDIKVMMAAYDSDNQPIVTFNGNPVKNIQDGYGIVSTRAGSGNEMKLSGTVSIRKKSGEMKTEKWETSVVVMKPQGTISIPAYNILYKNYPNEIEAVASGFDETFVTGTAGMKFTKKGTKYIVDPGTARTCSMTIYGKNKKDSSRKMLGTFNYKVASLPTPQLYFGSLSNGTKASVSLIKTIKRLKNAYDPSSPLNIAFSTLQWDISIEGTNLKADGKTDQLNQKAFDILRQVRKGNRIIITSKALGAKTASITSCIIVAE